MTMSTINSKNIFAMFILVVVATFTTYAHIPGPNYIYKCPKCSNLLKRGSNISGNTFGATLYSDGKMIAPMFPEFPNLTKCKKCDTILWLSETKELGTCGAPDKKCKTEWQKADRAEFLEVSDLFRFLEFDTVQNNKEKEKIVRQQIWWTFNDRVREGKEIFNGETEEDLWKLNCQRLIELFDMTDINQKVMVAELYRQLGDFDECLKIINSLDEQYDWIVNKLKIECENGNKQLVKLI